MANKNTMRRALQRARRERGAVCRREEQSARHGEADKKAFRHAVAHRKWPIFWLPKSATIPALASESKGLAGLSKRPAANLLNLEG